MGTLFNQPQRRIKWDSKSRAKEVLRLASELSRDWDIPLSESLKAIEISEIFRSNELYINNGDAFDEQISGIGKILQAIMLQLENIAEKGGRNEV